MLILSGIFIIIGILFLVLGVKIFINQGNRSGKKGCTKLIKGTIVNYESLRVDEELTVDVPIVRYYIEGIEYEKKLEETLGDKRTALGEEVSIYINPFNYEDYYIDYVYKDKVNGFGAFFFVPGIIVLLIGINFIISCF